MNTFTRAFVMVPFALSLSVCLTEATEPPLSDVQQKEVEAIVKATHDEVAATQKMLLYRVNHEVLASEARSFAATVEWGKAASKPGGYYLKGDDIALPTSIRVLKPSSVRVFDDRVEIEFGGALFYQGLRIFREANSGTGTKKLGKGVWFYSQEDKIFE
jgi:hypothetical protein